MIKIGDYNRLRIVKSVDFGLYLDGGNGVEILLPAKYVTCSPQIGDEIEVFVYTDSEDRLIATTEKPFARVGEFAFLQVNAVNRVGAFLDWGLPKDLLVPFREQGAKMREGGIYLVYVYLDNATKRVAASSKIEKFLDNVIPHLKYGDSVTALPYKHVEAGYKCIVDNAYSGIIYENEIYAPIVLGETLMAYVKKVREDMKIDLSLRPIEPKRVRSLSDKVYSLLKEKGGSLNLSDSSSPEEIKEMFACSKKDFKKAIGALYKEKKILIYHDYISLNE